MNQQSQAKFLRASSGALALVAAAGVFALSILLPPGATRPVPATTAATEPDLVGTVLKDDLLPFVIKGPNDEVLCEGQLQDRVVRSTKTGLLDYYYMIRDTRGPGAINRIATSSFGKQAVRVAFRTDGLGTVPPREAQRSAGPGDWVRFEFPDPPIVCARHEESRFVLIKTASKAFRKGGETQIIATTGAQFTVPTLMPQ